MTDLRRILVANRGEIACRVFRTVREMGKTSIAVYSDADVEARHPREADLAVRIGPAAVHDSYLSVERILDAAQRSGADAVHPGYGFLAENAGFARAVEAAGLTWIGPPAHAIDAMGDKISAKRLAAAAGAPVVPGRAEPGMTDADLAAAAAEIGWPVLVKPSAGGGGKGMHMVRQPAELGPALERARREARASFGDDTLFVERYMPNPRHIEVQVLADALGAVIHLGERECSLQRRHQKVIEEAPSPLLDPPTRSRIGAAACDVARSVGYAGAGTVEFIVSADRPDEFFFMEMNTRLQVEHPVTEMVTGIDLVWSQITIAEGRPLTLSQDQVVMRGHAVEARVYAEDPDRGFLPTAGTVGLLRGTDPAQPAHGTDEVRVDSGLVEGAVVGTEYDPMLAKVIAHAPQREEALDILDRALADVAVLGVTTNLAFLRGLLDHPRVRAGDADTGLIDGLVLPPPPPADDAAYAAAVLHAVLSAGVTDDPWNRGDGWRPLGQRAPRRWRFRAPDDEVVEVELLNRDAEAWELSVNGSAPAAVRVLAVSADGIDLGLGGRRVSAWVWHDASTDWVHLDGRTWTLPELPPARIRGGGPAEGSGELRSPMPGTVIAVPVAVGSRVAPGDVVAVVEAMKMEHSVTAAVAGEVAEVLVVPGRAVSRDQPLVRLVPDTAGSDSG